MPDIVLRNKNGESITYKGIDTVTFDTPTQEKGATFIHGTPVEDAPIELDLANGNQNITMPDGYYAKSAIIQKPDNLTPENIKSGVDIAGVVGEMVGSGEDVTVDLDFSDGNQVVTPPENTLYSQVTINKPDSLTPENVAMGVNIGGVVGNMVAAPDVDWSSPLLDYFSYSLDTINKRVTLKSFDVNRFNASTNNSDTISIPSKIGDYNVELDTSFKQGIFSLYTVNKSFDIHNDVLYLDNKMDYMFHNCQRFNGQLHIPSTVESINYLLRNCNYFNQKNITIPEGIKYASGLFYEISNYGYNPSVTLPNSLETCDYMFYKLNYFNQPITLPSNIKNCYGMFSSCEKFNSPVTIKDGVSSCFGLFSGTNIFNQDVTIPNSVTNTSRMFSSANNFNKVVNIPDGVVDMSYMFSSAKVYNHPIDIPSSVKNMSSSFLSANTFNSLVTFSDGVVDMSYMFSYSNNFNKPITLPNSSINTTFMFNSTNKFNQPIIVPNNVTNVSNMFSWSKLFNSSVTFGSNVINMAGAFYNVKMNNQNIIIYSPNVNNVYRMLYNRNSTRLNIYVPYGSATNSIIYSQAQSTNNFINGSLIWTVNNTCYYNTSRNIYVYPVNDFSTL